MDVAIIKYNAGNIYSVDCALKRVGINPIITDSHEVIAAADRVIFPGVGEAASTMQYLQQHGLDQVICNLKQPVLGICIGMQLMCRSSEEGNTPCLGIFDVDVKRFQPTSSSDKVPHMGWNTITHLNTPILPSEIEGEYVYFVHSYYAPLCADTVAQTEYITPFSAALQRDNFYATQFHIEKSGRIGENIMTHFLNL